MKSTKTTIGGIIAIIATLALLASKLLNDVPITTSTIIELFALFGLGTGAAWTGFNARDDNVTSEGTTAPKSQTPE